MPPATPGKIVRGILTERVDERTSVVAGIALDPKVLGLQGRAPLEESECSLAVRSTVDEPVPWKVIKVPVTAGK